MRDRFLEILAAIVADPDRPIAELAESSETLVTAGQARESLGEAL